MQATLSTLIPAAQKARLADAVSLRTSCRAYAGAPTTEQAALLAYHTGRLTLPGAFMMMTPLPEDAFTNITGCRMAAALLVRDGSWQTCLNAGAIGEAFVLEATALGLGTCWVGGSYRREAVAGHIPAGAALLCLIAVGVPAQPLVAPITRRRMAPEQLCRGDWRNWPESCIQAAALVQQAPSGMNQQPWALLMTPTGEFALDSSVHTAVDAGVALLHAELALTAPHVWRLSGVPGTPLATVVPLR